jgi:cytochrome c biogenesis protein CcmG/thiol:disulfide interchange protein DsbE
MQRALATSIAAALALRLGAALLQQPAAADAPAFRLVDCEGEPVTLEQYEGKPLVLNFWATWCPPCQHEIPALSAYATANPDVSVVGVAVDSGPSDHMPQLRTDLGIEYEIYAGNSAMLRAYGVRGLPTTVVIGADGEVSSTWTGAIDQQQLARLVKKAR